jgi:hypothetical protein
LIPRHIIEWLLEPEDLSVKYRTSVELLDRPLDEIEVQKYRSQIAESDPVRTLLGKMHPDGYWLQKNPRTGEVLGDGTEYGAFATTHYCLSYLAELGMDRSHPQVSKAAERYLALQKGDGDFCHHYSCLLGYNIRTFVMLGYKDDPRTRKSIDLMLTTERPDGGYLCDIHEGKYKTRPVKSCIRGGVKALLAFSYLPEHWKNTRIRKLVDYLSRDGIFKKSNLEVFVNKDMERNSFPIIWRANVFEVLLALSKMGYGNDGRLERAWTVLDTRRDTRGKYRLDWTPGQSPWKIGKRNEPNKWVTFYSYLAHKSRQ